MSKAGRQAKRKAGVLPRSKSVIVVNTIVPANETLFPEKLKKINDMLANVKWMD